MKYRIKNPKADHRPCCSIGGPWTIIEGLNLNCITLMEKRNNASHYTNMHKVGHAYRYWVNDGCIEPDYSLEDLVKDCKLRGE